jgi:hypothetical protein
MLAKQLMTQSNENWFETGEFAGRSGPRVSKFMRREFIVPVDFVKARWPHWTEEERVIFASAFSVRTEIDANDICVLDFLMENGHPPLWRTTALLVAKHPDRSRALTFLLARIKEGSPPLANYYQALGILRDSDTALSLQEALARHGENLEQHPSIQTWDDRLKYVDYVSCSVALFSITRREEYRANIKKVSQHPDEFVRQNAKTIAKQAGILIS